MSETTWTTRDGRMTDDMLDQLDILASEFVHRTGHSEILVVPRLVAEIKRLRSILSSVRAVAQDELRWIDAQPILRALEETP